MAGAKRRVRNRGSRRTIGSFFGGVEPLEERRVLATFTVTSGFDTGVGIGELRAAIFQANNTPGHDTIVFAPHISTINLIHGELDIIDDLTIDGSTTLEGNVTIRAALSNARIFNVDDTDSVIDMSVQMNRLTLTGGSVMGAASNGGGAIRNVEVLRLQNTVITNNQANFGGGIANYGALYLDRVTIDGNQASQDGGGILASAPGSLDMERVTISQNSAGRHGGGIALRGAGTQLRQTTIAYNAAGARGGGVHVDQLSGPLVTIAHSTVTGNTAVTEGGGVHASSATVKLDQTIVASNTTSTTPGTPDIVGSANLTARYSLIGNRLGSVFVEAAPDANGNLVGGPTGGVVDPRLEALAHNGGATATMLLRTGSPAINAGDPSFSSPPSFDQRGAPYPRVAASRIDIGAVEYISQGPDFDGNGVLDCADIDQLVFMIATGANHPRFDLNGDGQVNHDDLTRWLEWAGGINLGDGRSYQYGDANLDGQVDGSDFGVWNAHKFTVQQAWCRGDLNADGFVDGSDFGVWNANKFTSSLAMTATPGTGTAVPVPLRERDIIAKPATTVLPPPAALRAFSQSAGSSSRARRLASDHDAIFASDGCWDAFEVAAPLQWLAKR